MRNSRCFGFENLIPIITDVVILVKSNPTLFNCMSSKKEYVNIRVCFQNKTNIIEKFTHIRTDSFKSQRTKFHVMHAMLNIHISIKQMINSLTQLTIKLQHVEEDFLHSMVFMQHVDVGIHFHLTFD